MSQVDISHLKKLKSGVKLFYADKEGLDASTHPLDDIQEEDWKVLAQLEEFQSSVEEENDKHNYTSAVTGAMASIDESVVVADKFQAKAVDWSIYLWNIIWRTDETIVAGQLVPTHQKSSAWKKVWLRIEHWAPTKELLYTEYSYCNIKVSMNQAENMKLLQPVIDGEQIPALNQGIVATAAMGAPAAAAETEAEGSV